MPLTLIDLGSVPNDHSGDTLREAGAKINADMQQIDRMVNLVVVSQHGQDLAISTLQGRVQRLTLETVQTVVHGAIPKKTDCQAAAALLVHPPFDYGQNREFMLYGGEHSGMYLIHYQANGDTDISGTAYTFWIESLSEAM